MGYGKIIYKDLVLIDLTNDTVIDTAVKSDLTFHDKNGELKVGRLGTWYGNNVVITQLNDYGYEIIVSAYEEQENEYSGKDLIIDMEVVDI